MTLLFHLVVLAVATFGFALWRGRTHWRGRMPLGGGSFSTATNQNRLTGMKVGYPTRAAVQFELTREDAYDRFAKRMGWVLEGQVGVPRFDDALYLQCDDPHVLTGLRFDADLPDALLGLFDVRSPYLGDVRRVVCREGMLRIEASAHGEENGATRIAKDVMPALREVALRLDAAAGLPRPDPLWRPAALLVALSGGLAVNAGVQALRMFQSPIVTLEPVAMWALGIALGMVGAAVLIATTVRWLGKSSRLHRVLLDVVLIGVPGLVLGSVIAVRDFNIDADGSVATEYETTKVSERDYKGGRYVTVAAWPGSHGNREFDADPYAAYDKAVVVRVRTGALGLAWVESVEPRSR